MDVTLENFTRTLTDEENRRGSYRCPACKGIVEGGRTVKVKGTSPRQPKGISFRIGGCGQCGHIVRHDAGSDPRDLTRAEAAELAASPDFLRVRERVVRRLEDRWLIG